MMSVDQRNSTVVSGETWPGAVHQLRLQGEGWDCGHHPEVRGLGQVVPDKP